LSKFIGDTLAYQVMQKARGTFKWLKQSFDTVCGNTQEYLQEEARFTPSAAEVEDFYQAVATLRDDVDRVEHKINHWLARKKHV
ncbi:MAG TPA: hypothetical protein VD770_01850, partial [Coxiellaceae bacterium]|nr:hypothetical protein [Coxiellaceae bacterium]